MSFFDDELLTRVLDNDPTLTDMSTRIYTDAEASVLGNAISGNYVLRTLNFCYSDLSGDRASLLLSKIPRNIERLTLCNCEIKSQGVKLLARLALECCISFLDLRHNEIGDEGARLLSAAMKHKECTWTSLILGNCMIGDTGARHLTKGLGLRGFQQLDLRGNEIGNRGIFALSRALSLGIDLERLDLRDNRIGNEGAHSLALALTYTHTCDTLKNLNLTGNHIGDSGAEMLAKALKLNSTLKCLNLSGNSIGEVGAEAFLDAMEYNSAVFHLNLSQNTVSREVREEIAKVLEANRTGKRKARTLVNSEANSNSVGNGDGRSGRRGQRVSKSVPDRRPRGFFALLRYAVACS
jgi:Ran GTPase-activating protein (RanGAP) involved in mRNA processing and transport